MNFFKENTKHTIHLYIIAAGIMALAIISGLTWNRIDGDILKIMCDGFSLCAACFFLTSYFYRPKGKGFRAVMGYYIRHLRGKTAKNAELDAQDKEMETIITNDFMDSLFLLWVSGGLTIILLIVYMIVR